MNRPTGILPLPTVGFEPNEASSSTSMTSNDNPLSAGNYYNIYINVIIQRSRFNYNLCSKFFNMPREKVKQTYKRAPKSHRKGLF